MKYLLPAVMITLALTLSVVAAQSTYVAPFRLTQTGSTYTVTVRGDAPAGILRLTARHTEWVSYDPGCTLRAPTALVCAVQPGQAISFTARTVVDDSLRVELVDWAMAAFRLPVPHAAYPAPPTNPPGSSVPADSASQAPVPPDLTLEWSTDPARLIVTYTAGEPVTVEWAERPELILNPPGLAGSFTLCTCSPDQWYKPLPGRAIVLWSSDRRELARAVVPWPYTIALPYLAT